MRKFKLVLILLMGLLCFSACQVQRPMTGEDVKKFPAPPAGKAQSDLDAIKQTFAGLRLPADKMKGFTLQNSGENFNFNSREALSPVGLRFESWEGKKGSFNLIYAVYQNRAAAQKAYQKAVRGGKPISWNGKKAMQSEEGFFYLNDRSVVSLSGGDISLLQKVLDKLP